MSRDPREIRALAHPLRIRILDLLDERRVPMTATQISEEVGESPSNCSFHLRTLAKYGFVEEAEGGTGRNRPWQRVSGSFYVDDNDPDPEVRSAARAFSAVKREAAFRKLEHWTQNREAYPEAWRDVGFESEIVTPLTPAELKEISSKLFELVVGIRDGRDAPPDAVPVVIYSWGFPLGRPPEPKPEGES